MRFTWVILIFFFIPINVAAITCDDKVYDLKVAASNLIKTSYSYNPSNDKMAVNVLNIPNDFYVTVGDGTKKYIPVNQKISLGDYPQGESLLIHYHYNQDLGCGRGDLVNRIYVSLPYYNPYHTDERCKTREGLAACGQFYPVILNKEDFNQAIYYYDDRVYTTKTEVVEPKVKIEPDPWYYKYRYYLIATGLIIIAGGAYLIYRLRMNKIGSEL